MRSSKESNWRTSNVASPDDICKGRFGSGVTACSLNAAPHYLLPQRARFLQGQNPQPNRKADSGCTSSDTAMSITPSLQQVAPEAMAQKSACEKNEARIFPKMCSSFPCLSFVIEQWLSRYSSWESRASIAEWIRRAWFLFPIGQPHHLLPFCYGAGNREQNWIKECGDTAGADYTFGCCAEQEGLHFWVQLCCLILPRPHCLNRTNRGRY